MNVKPIASICGELLIKGIGYGIIFSIATPITNFLMRSYRAVWLTATTHTVEFEEKSRRRHDKNKNKKNQKLEHTGK